LVTIHTDPNRRCARTLTEHDTGCSLRGHDSSFLRVFTGHSRVTSRAEEATGSITLQYLEHNLPSSLFHKAFGGYYFIMLTDICQL
jgi:hypothetical protein